MRNLFTLLVNIIFVTFSFGQSANSKECKTNLRVDAIVESVEKIHYIFTGSDTTGLNVKVTKIKVSEAKTEMVKRRNKNCNSPNIEDCFVNVMEEIPAVTMNLYTLPNADQTDEYDIRKEMVTIQKRKSGDSETAIVCPKNRSKKLMLKVQTALIAKGYPLQPTGTLDEATKLAITDFQRDQKMAYGDLTLEILAVLGVK